MNNVRLITKNIVQLTHNRGYGYSNRLYSDQRCTTVPTRHNPTTCYHAPQYHHSTSERNCDITPRTTQLTTVHRSWIIISPSNQRQWTPQRPPRTSRHFSVWHPIMNHAIQKVKPLPTLACGWHGKCFTTVAHEPVLNCHEHNHQNHMLTTHLNQVLIIN